MLWRGNVARAGGRGAGTKAHLKSAKAYVIMPSSNVCREAHLHERKYRLKRMS